MKRTYQPSRVIRKRRHGFRARMATKAGRQIINRPCKRKSSVKRLIGLMAHKIFTIKKRSTFVMVRNEGKFVKSKNMNVQILHNQDLENSIGIGYTASKKIGNAVKRNKAKRIMRELARKILINGKINSYYVLIAKTSLLEEKFEKLLLELKEKAND